MKATTVRRKVNTLRKALASITNCAESRAVYMKAARVGDDACRVNDADQSTIDTFLAELKEIQESAMREQDWILERNRQGLPASAKNEFEKELSLARARCE
jgi:hypothetical protein